MVFFVTITHYEVLSIKNCLSAATITWCITYVAVMKCEGD